MSTLNADAKDWFLSKIHINRDGCWLWQGAVGLNPCPRAKIGGHYVNKYDLVSNQASRSAYALWRPKEFDESLCVLHGPLCNRDTAYLCVCPYHLHQGDMGQNNIERTEYGNQRRGIDVPRSILTEQQVLRIRRLWRQGLTKPEIARRLGMKVPNRHTHPTRYRRLNSLISSAMINWKHL